MQSISKKIIATFLAITLLLTTVTPIVVFADSEEFDIDGITLKIAGDDDVHHESLSIQLYYDGSSLYEKLKTLTEVKIDEKVVPLTNADGRKTFVQVNDTLNCYATTDSPEGTAAVEDFKGRTKHRVEISFGDSEHYQFEDDGYVPRTDLGEELSYTINYYKGDELLNKVFDKVPADNPVVTTVEDMCPDGYELDTDNSTVLPFTVSAADNIINIKYKEVATGGGGNTTGIADKYDFDQIQPNWNSSAYDISFYKKATHDITKLTAEDFNKITSIIVNGDSYTKDKFELKSWGDIRTEDATVIASYKKATPIIVTINFNDSSKITNDTNPAPTTLEYTINYFKGDESLATITGTVPADNPVVTTVEDMCPDGYELDTDNSTTLPFTVSAANNIINIKYKEVATGGGGNTTGIADAYVIRKVKGNDYADIFEIEINPDLSDAHVNKISTININGDVYTFDLVKFRNYWGDIRSRESATDLFASWNKNTENPYVLVTFDDNSTLKYGTAPSAELSYTVNYFKGDESFATVTGTVPADNPVVNSVEDKCPTGYELDTDNSTTLPFTVSAANNIINIKYKEVTTGGGGNTTGIADAYVIRKVKGNDYADIFEIEINPDLSDAHVNKISTININGDVYTFDLVKFRNYWGDIRSRESATDLFASWNKNTENPYVLVTFDDNSTLKYGTAPSAELSYTVNYFKGDESLATVTGTVPSDNPVVTTVEDKCPDGYELDTDNSTALPFTVSATNNVINIKYKEVATGGGGNTTGIGDKYDIDQIQPNWNSSAYDISFYKKGTQNIAKLTAEDFNEITSIIINGDSYTKDKFELKSWGDIRTEDADVIASYQKATPIVVTINFSDDSNISNGTQPEPSLTLSSDLETGEYTLKFKAYVVNTNQSEESSLSSYFDERAKLVVDADGNRTVTLLNPVFAEMILDLAIKNNTFESMTSNTVEEKNGEPIKVSYTGKVTDLTTIYPLAVLGNGMLGGNASEIGDYANPHYKKVDLVFTDIEEGFTKFKVIEEEEAAAAANDENLIQGLISADVDANGDNVITEDELYNAVGNDVEIYFKEGKISNVIDLSGLDLVNLDKLTELGGFGPNIKGVLLNNNNLKTLPKDLFKKATGLEYLLIRNNKIANLDADLFINCPKLKVLDASSNNFGDIPAGLLRNNSKLKILSLSGANVTSVPADLIQNCTRLEELYLQENKLETLADNFFSGQAGSIKLGAIYLSHNKLTTLPSSLGDVSYLRQIHADNNQLVSIPESLANIDVLEKLNLENNHIKEVPAAILEAMITNAPEIVYGVRIDLSMNDLVSLPINAMKNALNNGGKALTLFEVDRNFLPTNLSQTEIADLKSVGIEFEKSVAYFPQKQMAGASALATNGDIQLSQRFDILEMYYWLLGDNSFFNDDAKEVFMTSDEFEDYLLKIGRDIHNVNRDEARDKAIQAILNDKDAEWKVSTTITKNNGELVLHKEGNKNDVDGQIQLFEDPNMKAGEEYVIVKDLYINGIFGWTKEFTIRQTVTAKSDANNDFSEIPVELMQKGTNDPSVAASSLNPVALYEEKDGKHTYKVSFKPTTMAGQTAEIDYIEVKGQKINSTPAIGEYNREFTFELNDRPERLTIKISSSQMPMKPSADLVFDYTNYDNKPIEKTVKAYVLKDDKSGLSMANNSIDHNLKLYKAVNDVNYTATITFNDLTTKDMTVGVDELKVKLNGSFVAATAVAGKDGTFTFELPADMVTLGSEKDAELDIKFGLSPKISGHEDLTPAVLLLDWNNDFDPTSLGSGSGNGNGNGQGETNYGFEDGKTYLVDVTMMKELEDVASMGNRAFADNRKAKITRNGSNYTIKLVTNPIKVGVITAGIKELIKVDENIQSIANEEATENGVTYAKNINITVNKIKSEYMVKMTVEGMPEAQKARLVFDLDGKTPYVNNSGSGNNAGAGNANSNPTIPDDETPLAGTAAQQFDDVEEDDWYYEGVNYAVEKKLFKGTSEKTFSPKDFMTRGMIVTVLQRLKGDTAKSVSNFTDVGDDKYYSDAINWAHENDIVKGYGNKFAPNDKVTREQLATFIYRYMTTFRGVKANDDSAISGFADASEVSDYAVEAMNWAVENGIIKGTGQGLDPKGTATRAQVAIILSRIAKLK